MNSIELNNGVKIPNIGIGTFQISAEETEVSIREALKMGYRLIDTASSYCNERAVGRGIKASGIPREEIFLSTKLWPNEYENTNAINDTLERLNLNYIDLLFIHQPCGNYMAGYKQIEQAYKEGKVKSIGIANFEGEYIQEILTNCEIKPQVIQVECHPYYVQEELREVIDKENIKLMSWFPLGKGDKNLFEEPVLIELGNKYNKTPAQIILKWHISMGFIPIPGSKNIDHIKENLNIFDFNLTKEDIEKIATVNKQKRYYQRTDQILAYFARWHPGYEKE